MKRLTVCALVLIAVGCERYVESETPVLTSPDREYVLAFVFDTSGSFTAKLFDGDQPGFRFSMNTAERFFQDRMGTNDRILISQLSGEEKTLLWEGAPLSLRRRFRSSSALQQFLLENSDTQGSHAYAALADTLDYILEMPGVSEGRTKVCVVVLSDMLDNSPTRDEDRKRMTEALNRFSTVNGCIGLYWVDQSVAGDVRACLKDSGVTGLVEVGIVEDPVLPSFE